MRTLSNFDTANVFTLSFSRLWKVVIALLLTSIILSCSGTTPQSSPTPVSKFVPPITPVVHQGTILFTGHGQGYPVWSSGGKHMAFVNGGNANGGNDVYVWDTSSGKLTLKITFPLLTANTHEEYLWSPDGQSIVFAADDGKLQIWNSFTGKKLLTYDSHTAYFPEWAWSPDGKRVALTENYGGNAIQTIQIWDIAIGKETLAFSTQLRNTYDLYWSPQGNLLASFTTDKTVQFWDVATGKASGGFFDPALDDIVWSPDGRRILSSLTANVTKDTSLRIWDVATGRKLLTYPGHKSNAYTAQWSPDSTRILSVSQQEALLWNAGTGHTILSLPNTSSGTAVLSPDGKYLADSERDNSIHIWNALSGNEFLSYVGPIAHIQAIAWSPDSTRVAFASDNSTVQIWDITAKNMLSTYRVASDSVQYLAWSPDSRLVATASQDNIVQVLQVI